MTFVLFILLVSILGLIILVIGTISQQSSVVILGGVLAAGAFAAAFFISATSPYFYREIYSNRRLYIVAISSDKLNCREKYEIYSKLKLLNKSIKETKEARKTFRRSFISKDVDKTKLVDLNTLKPYLKACKISDL